MGTIRRKGIGWVAFWAWLKYSSIPPSLFFSMIQGCQQEFVITSLWEDVVSRSPVSSETTDFWFSNTPQRGVWRKFLGSEIERLQRGAFSKAKSSTSKGKENHGVNAGFPQKISTKRPWDKW